MFFKRRLYFCSKKYGKSFIFKTFVRNLFTQDGLNGQRADTLFGFIEAKTYQTYNCLEIHNRTYEIYRL